MDVILKQDVDHLGSKDELVTVKDGYGRNFLIPTGKAVQATASLKKMHEETLRQRAHKEAKVIESAKKAAESLKGMAVKVGAKVGENGKIFGSVNSLQVAEAIKKLGFDVDRKGIKISEDPIKNVGKYSATIKFHKEVVETLEFEVVEE